MFKEIFKLCITRIVSTEPRNLARTSVFYLCSECKFSSTEAHSPPPFSYNLHIPCSSRISIPFVIQKDRYLESLVTRTAAGTTSVV